MAAGDPPILTISHLDKTYGTGDTALTDVSLTVGAGHMVGLIGPSGAGKSTLLRCVNRLVEPSGGQVLLETLDITRMRGTALRRARRRMGMIFQEYALVERLTVMENVLAGQLGYVGFLRSFLRRFPVPVVQRAWDLLGRVELQAHADKRADELSGGQRQRVGIARALLQQPDILLVDEPTASLDPRTSRQIMQLLCELCEESGLAAIINIHDVSLARAFLPRLVGLREGRIVFDGAPDDVTHDRLTEIYGEADWNASRTGVREQGVESGEPLEIRLSGLD